MHASLSVDLIKCVIRPLLASSFVDAFIMPAPTFVDHVSVVMIMHIVYKK